MAVTAQSLLWSPWIEVLELYCGCDLERVVCLVMTLDAETTQMLWQSLKSVELYLGGMVLKWQAN